MLKEYIKEQLTSYLTTNTQVSKLMYYSDIVNHIVDEWLANKPWWYLINLYHEYEDEFKEVAHGWNLKTNRDLRDIARDCIKFITWDLVTASPQMDVEFEPYKDEDKPHFWDDRVAKELAYDLEYIV
nr:hypothetical protein JOCKYQNQ_JOCKYQNQ_CDS_0025 [Autographiviridae sp.]